MDERVKNEERLANDSARVNSLWALGNGTAANPFVISNAEEFDGIRENLAAFYRLAADIDFQGEEIVPIGSATAQFTGGLDGDGHVLKNFRPGIVDTCTGLFGSARAAKFKNVSIENAKILQAPDNILTGILAGYLNQCTAENVKLSGIMITGGGNVGGIAGSVNGGSFTGCSVGGGSSIDCSSGGAVGGLIGAIQDGIVRRCCVNAEISGGTYNAGGLIGRAMGSAGKIEECYAAGSVTGKCAGGLVGNTSASISNSFALGRVMSVINQASTGGLAGIVLSANIKNCYAACRVSTGGKGFVYVDKNAITVIYSFFDVSLVDIKVSSLYNTGKPTSYMMKKDTYVSWDFTGTWDIEEGLTYPFLRGMERPDWHVTDRPLTGEGTETDPYLIRDTSGFDFIKLDLAANYELISDIDFEGEVVLPTGSTANPFTGKIDGKGHMIRNFKAGMSNPYSGLFGKAQAAVFQNLIIKGVQKKQGALGSHAGALAGHLENCMAEHNRLEDIKILGEFCAGALAGVVSGGSITDCSVKGNSIISSAGNNGVGGLVGEMSDCEVLRCFSEANVHGGIYTGGLAGKISGSLSKIRECYAVGSISGKQYAGGLAGYASGQICDSFATGSAVSRTNFTYTGGLAGYFTLGTITNSYAACKVSARASGLVCVDKNVTVTDSYFDSEVADTAVSNGYNVAKPTSDLMGKDFSVRWDFAGIWDMEAGHTYPFLRSIGKPDWQGADNGELPVGSGTVEDPYLIGNAKGFEYVKYDPAGCYKLTSDIDFQGEIITPMGTTAMPFTGELDGDGYTLGNYTAGTVDSYSGLFGKAVGAKFRNLVMEGVETKQDASVSYTGALAGYLDSCITEQIRFVDINIAGIYCTGAVAGSITKGSITGCSVKGSSIISSTGDMGTGGLAGEVSYCAVGRCSVQATVNGGNNTGGLIGKLSASNSSPGRVSECYAAGKVTGKQYVGGLVGHTTTAAISDSFAAGSVISIVGSGVGGLAGYAGSASIRNSYAACKVGQIGGGLVCAVNTTVTGSYFDSAVAENIRFDGNNIGKLTGALIKKDLYRGWDFTAIWDIEDGHTYPFLRSLGKPEGHEPDMSRIPKGTGTEADPYLILDTAGFGYLKYDVSGYYKLLSDIDLEGKTVTPTGTNTVTFTGGLDGGGHVLKNFKISYAGSYSGLFGKATGAKFKNLIMENVETQKDSSSGYAGILAGFLQRGVVEDICFVDVVVSGRMDAGVLAGASEMVKIKGCFVKGDSTVNNTGNSATGGLIGYALDTVISQCYVEAEVNGGDYTGGLFGHLSVNANNTGGAYECYAAVKVSGRQYVGGLAGTAGADIINSFATGSVTATVGYIGGLVGTASLKSIKNCYAACKLIPGGTGLVISNNTTVTSSYFDSVVAGVTRSDGRNMGKLTVALIRKEFYKGWDFTDIWDIEEKSSYPYLRRFGKPEGHDPDTSNLPQGTGTEKDPYVIRNASEFGFIKYDLAGYYGLSSDMDFQGETLIPLGAAYGLPFTGGLDGCGYALRNFKISAASNYSGLFAQATGAKFKNMILEKVETAEGATAYYTGVLAGFMRSCMVENIDIYDIHISGRVIIGALAGSADKGSITGCSVRGKSVISSIGDNGTGGLIGEVLDIVVSRCYVDADVSGGNNTGGLIGQIAANKGNPGKISECYAAGSVTGKQYVGGLVGYAKAPVSNSFATGNVISTTNDGYTGGLAGFASYTSITNSYAACKFSTHASGLVAIMAGNNVTVTKSYFDSAAAGIVAYDGFKSGKLSVALIKKTFYTGWDFTNIWGIEEGSSYPYLQNTRRPEWHEPDIGNLPTGAGTEMDPYLIQDARGLEYIRSELGGYYRLVSDIDFYGGIFIPIGTNTVPFTGGLDGDGHTLKNFTISASGAYAGVFGYAKGAKLKNLTIKKAVTQQVLAVANVGALAGYLDMCTTENISLIDVALSGIQYAGALTGTANNGSVIGCSVKGESTVSNTGNNARSYGTGGLIGYVNYCVVGRCYSGAEVSGGDYTGGLTGRTSGSTAGQGRIYECAASGNVTGKQYVGGLVGNAGAAISNSFAEGNVTSTANNAYTGGLAGYAGAINIISSYAACRLSPNASGLAMTISSTKVTNSYFDSTLAGVTAPAAQARTTVQMSNKGNYIGWDWQNIWTEKENSYPYLRNLVGAVCQEAPVPVLTVTEITDRSAALAWQQVQGADGYDICYCDKTKSTELSQLLIENLLPETDYEFQVRAAAGPLKGKWSEALKIRTQKSVFVNGIHSTDKTQDSLTLTWNPIDDTESYDVIYSNHIQKTGTNTCVLTGLDSGTTYTVNIQALAGNGEKITGDTIIGKIYTLDPQTDYARELIGKCEGQTWFMDEIEKILSLQGKSINTIDSKEDLAAIYAIGLADRDISGSIPRAIGELHSLQYLYLANNNLSGTVPDELLALEQLKEMDLSGNHFTNQ